MNQPLRKLGKLNGQTIYNLNGKQTALPYGFCPTVVYIGMNEKGQPTYAKNRKQRREHLQKASRRRAFGCQKWKQVVPARWVKEGPRGKETLRFVPAKVIVHPVLRKETKMFN